jgi:hypothetical protein
MPSLRKNFANNHICRVKKNASGRKANLQPRTNIKGRWLTGASFAHHPRTEKKGVEIHRSINAEATTVDQAPGRLLRRGLVS